MLKQLLDELHAMEARYHELLDPEKSLSDKSREVVKAIGQRLLNLESFCSGAVQGLHARMDKMQMSQRPAPQPQTDNSSDAVISAPQGPAGLPVTQKDPEPQNVEGQT